MVPPGSENKVMHASFLVGETTVMASDGSCSGQPAFQGFSLSLTVPDTPKPTGCSLRSPTAGRCECR